MATTPEGPRTTPAVDPLDREGRFERTPRRVDRPPRRGRGPETKHAFKTTEFMAYVAATIGVLIAGLATQAGDGHGDPLHARDTWMIVGILTVGYMISRGLAKSGTRAARWEDDPDDH